MNRILIPLLTILITAMIAVQAITDGFLNSAPAEEVQSVVLATDNVKPRQLPNECALLATEAFERLRATGVWVRLIHLTIKLPNGFIAGHAIIIWQLYPGSTILAFDETIFQGTVEVPTTSQSLKTIIPVMNEHLYGIEITEAHVIQ